METATISAWAALVSAITALVTMIVSFSRSRRLLIAPMRLEWITTLRQHVTELTAETTRINREYNVLGTDKVNQDVRKDLLLLQGSGFNLSLIMRRCLGAGKPRQFQGLRIQLSLLFQNAVRLWIKIRKLLVGVLPGTDSRFDGLAPELLVKISTSTTGC